MDAVALITQIHLEQNRTDLAVKEVTAARRWAQDSILVNLAESWVGLRVVRIDLEQTTVACPSHDTGVQRRHLEANKEIPWQL